MGWVSKDEEARHARQLLAQIQVDAAELRQREELEVDLARVCAIRDELQAMVYGRRV